MVVVAEVVVAMVNVAATVAVADTLAVPVVIFQVIAVLPMLLLQLLSFMRLPSCLYCCYIFVHVTIL
jgi:hypothetical protein